VSKAPICYRLWSFRDDVLIEADPDTGAVILHSQWEDTALPPVTEPAIREALRRMSLGPILLENVARDQAELAAIERVLERLEHVVIRSIGVDADRPLISVVPLAPQARFVPTDLDSDRMIRLSRFAVLQSNGSRYHLESPLSLHRVILHETEAVDLIAALGRPVRPGAIAASPLSVAGLPTAKLLGYLVAAGMIVVAEPAEAGRQAVFAEDVDPALTFWRPVDLMFHVRTNLGRHDEEFGMTYPREDGLHIEPVVAPQRGGPAIDLYRPRLPELVAADPPFTAVVEGRRPLGRSDEPVLTARDVGELLYRTARVRSFYEEAREGHPRVTLSERPYPTSGSCYAFEVYTAVNTCSGIARGVYHYDPVRHQLEPLSAGDAGVDELLEAGRIGAGLRAQPPLLMVITARFCRLSWKYDGLSYALVLKDLGHLTQTALLVSTAMGLQSDTVEGSDIELSARVLGTDWRTESSVAAVVIGAQAEGGWPPEGENGVNDAGWADEAAAILARTSRRR
jgi:SagB-type dehydrogenase family enzyme